MSNGLEKTAIAGLVTVLAALGIGHAHSRSKLGAAKVLDVESQISWQVSPRLLWCCAVLRLLPYRRPVLS